MNFELFRQPLLQFPFMTSSPLSHTPSPGWLFDMNSAPFSDVAFMLNLVKDSAFYGFVSKLFSHANDTTRKTIPSKWNFQRELYSLLALAWTQTRLCALLGKCCVCGTKLFRACSVELTLRFSIQFARTKRIKKQRTSTWRINLIRIMLWRVCESFLSHFFVCVRPFGSDKQDWREENSISVWWQYSCGSWVDLKVFPFFS
jgi:hypothetical protein